MTLQPHDTDVKALTRLAGVENIVFCCNRSTADHIITSPLFTEMCIRDSIGTVRMLSNSVREGSWDQMKSDLTRLTADFQGVNIIGSGGNINKLYRLADKMCIRDRLFTIRQ